MPNTARDPQPELGLAIRQRREEAKVSQEALARLFNRDPGWISHLENGRMNPAYGTARRIAKALGCKFSELVALAESFESQEHDRDSHPPNAEASNST